MFAQVRGFRRASQPAPTPIPLGDSTTTGPRFRSASTTKKSPYITLTDFGDAAGGKYPSSSSDEDVELTNMKKERHSSTSHIRTFSASQAPIEEDISLLMEKRREELAQWGIHWFTPVSMYALYMLGLVSAFLHHFYYASLVDKPAVDQLTKVRYGTALAFFTKACFVGSVIVGFKQRIWWTMRRRALSLKGIDALFGMVEDPTWFMTWEVWRGAKVATLMGLATWLIPIASILSPASLTSINKRDTSTLELTVPTLSFSKENSANYRRPGPFPGYQLAFVNTTTTGHAKIDFDEFDWYDSPSKVADKIVTLSILSGKAITDSELRKSCKANCTYDITFEAPTYKCETYNEVDLPTKPLPPNTPSSMNWTSLVPTGDILYTSDVTRGDYAIPQNQSDPETPPGVFFTEPDVWMAYAVNTTFERPPDSPRFDLWHHDFSRHIVHCRHYAAEITVHVRLWNRQETYSIKKREYLAPLLKSEGSEEKSRFDTPMYPTFSEYNIFIAYHALATRLRSYLKGKITQLGCDFPPVTHSDINKTILVKQENSQPVKDLAEAFVRVYDDILLSLLSEPRLVVAGQVNVPVDTSEIKYVFSYQPRALWLGYALVMVFALIFLLVGTHALYENGVCSDTSFSRVLVTSRNRTIDRLAVGACLGGDPFPTELAKVKLRFGVLSGTAPKELYEAEEKASVASRTPLLREEKPTSTSREWGSPPLTSPLYSGNDLMGTRRWDGLDGSGDLSMPNTPGTAPLYTPPLRKPVPGMRPTSISRNPFSDPLPDTSYTSALSPPLASPIQQRSSARQQGGIPETETEGEVGGGGGRYRTIGDLEGRGEVGHCAFGTEAETEMIVKGGLYQ